MACSAAMGASLTRLYSSTTSYPFPAGEPRLDRCSNLPVAELIEVTVNCGHERIKVCSIEDPSVDAKYFSSLVKNIDELTKIGPGPFTFPASALTFSR